MKKIVSLIVTEIFLMTTLGVDFAFPAPTSSLLRPQSARDGGDLQTLRKEFEDNTAAKDGGIRGIDRTRGHEWEMYKRGERTAEKRRRLERNEARATKEGRRDSVTISGEGLARAIIAAKLDTLRDQGSLSAKVREESFWQAETAKDGGNREKRKEHRARERREEKERLHQGPLLTRRSLIIATGAVVASSPWMLPSLPGWLEKMGKPPEKTPIAPQTSEIREKLRVTPDTKRQAVAYLRSLEAELEKEEPKRKEVLKFMIDVFEQTEFVASLSLRGSLFMAVTIATDAQGNALINLRANPAFLVPLMEQPQQYPLLRIVAKSLLLKESGSVDASVAGLKEYGSEQPARSTYQEKTAAGIGIEDSSVRQLARELFSDWIEKENVGDFRMYPYLVKHKITPKILRDLATQVNSLPFSSQLASGINSVAKSLKNIVRNGQVSERRAKMLFAVGLYRMIREREGKTAAFFGALQSRMVEDVFRAEMLEGNITQEQLDRLTKDEIDLDQVAKPDKFLHFLIAPKERAKDGGIRTAPRLIEIERGLLPSYNL